MDDKRLLIVGIDPGITTAYAVLDIEGSLIHLKSSKQLDLNHLISEIIKFGKIVIVGTDKFKVPNLVGAFAAKLGAKIVSPEEDIKVDEKRKIKYNFRIEDSHQGDALASGLFAYQAVKPLLNKIDFFAKENKKQNIRNKIKELVISRRISIKNAVSIIEKKEETKIVEKAIAEKKSISQNDFLRLYNKLNRYEKEIKLMRDYNDKLKNKISHLEKNGMKKEEPKINDKKIADFRENRIKFLESSIKSKEKEIEHLKSLMRKFNDIISNIINFYILKKLDTLGINEFNLKNKILNIKKNDILLVDNPNIASSDVIDLLKNRVFIIVHKNPVSAKMANALPFIFINSKNLKIEEDRYFGFIDKKHFEVEKSKLDWVKKVIEDYKNEKSELVHW